MARILFIQLNEYELHGLEALAGELKKHGHAVRLLVRYFEKTPLREIEKFSPDIIGFPVVSSEREEVLAWARAIKSRFHPLIVLGGIDPTFFPELIAHEAVDIVCRGEAELAMAKLLDALDRKADYSGIENLWVKIGGEVHRNPVGPLVEELSQLAAPDKEIYYEPYRYFRNYPIKYFMASRGCPFSCTYCANQGLRELYPNRSSYLRLKTPSALLAEIKAVVHKYPVRTIGFNDDHFSHDLNWLSEFLPAYRKEVGIPFFCAGRIDQLNEDKVKALKQGGCYSLWYGLESANPEHRAEILGRKMSNQAIEAGMELLHRHGIITQSYNILNYPGETFQDALETLDYNLKLKNNFVVSSLFQPFPGTELARQAGLSGKGKNGKPVPSVALNYFAYSPFRQKDSAKIEKLHKLFIAAFRCRLIRRLLPLLARLPSNPLFDIIFLLSFGVDYSRVHRLTYWETISYNIGHIRTTYLQRKARVPEN